MKRSLLAPAACVMAAGVAGCGGSTPSHLAVQPANPGPPYHLKQSTGVNQRIETQPVSIGRNGYTPKRVSVKNGINVRWTNRDNRPHTVTWVSGRGRHFDSGPIKPGASFKLTIEHDAKTIYRSTAPGDGAKFRGVIFSNGGPPFNRGQ